MSTQEIDPSLRPKHYKPGTGVDRYIRFCEDWLGFHVTYPQAAILEALEEHRRVVVSTANGIGKSYDIAAGGIAALFTNSNCTVNITSGSYGQLDDTIWKPIKNLHRKSKLPGRVLDNTRELRTELNEEWYLKALSPRHPSELEGRHNDRMIYLVEEADKPGITREHIDSIESTITDAGDRVLVVANPPETESNVVHDLLASEKWHTINFASWDSHNIRVERGLEKSEKIGGLISLSEIEENWEDWNGEAWPGLETAIDVSTKGENFRDDLDTRWYRRRAGIMPPEGSEKWRPFGVSDVEQAFRREYENVRITPAYCGIDVARSGGDLTVMVGLHDDTARIEYEEVGDNHHSQRLELQDLLQEWPQPEVNVDAVGEGSGLADELDARIPNIYRFKNGEKSSHSEYRLKWGEGLQVVGEWLRNGGAFSNSDLYEELKIAARVVEFSEKTLRSQGTVIEATPKERIKEELGRSPDRLDALLMCLMARDGEDPSNDVPLSW